MSQQDMMKMFQSMQTFSTTMMQFWQQQQAATPAVPATPAPAPPAAPAPAPVVVAATPAPAPAPAPAASTPQTALQKLQQERINWKGDMDSFVTHCAKNPAYTQTIIANARGKPHCQCRDAGLRLLFKAWRGFDANNTPVWEDPKPTRNRKKVVKKPVKKQRPKTYKERKWKNMGDYYAVDDAMIYQRCLDALKRETGSKRLHSKEEIKYVQEIVAMVKSETCRADAPRAERLAAGDKFLNTQSNEKYEGRFFQIILDLDNLSNRKYGYMQLIRLYAPGCPPLQDRGITKKKKRPSPSPSPAAPLVISAPAQAIAQPAPKKQKVDDAVGSPTTVKDVKDLIPYRRQLLIKALKNCQLPDSQYSAEKWKSNYGHVLGCTKATFYEHIDVRLKMQGYTWDNWGQGKGKWCLDHMKPIRNFLQTDEDDVEKCWHYTNIMPEDYEYNTWKGDKDIWAMVWFSNQWHVQGRNHSFHGEEKYHTVRGMPEGAWRSYNRLQLR